MATKAGSGSYQTSRALVYTWVLGNGDVGTWLDVSRFSGVTVQVEGTFGTGGSISIEGSNDGTNAEVLSDNAGSAITLTAKGLKAITQAPKLLRPHVTAGDGSTALTVTLVARPNI